MEGYSLQPHGDMGGIQSFHLLQGLACFFKHVHCIRVGFQFPGEEGRGEAHMIRKCDLFLTSVVLESCQWKVFPKGAL